MEIVDDELTSAAANGTITKSGLLPSESLRAKAHTKLYYEEIRQRKSDVRAIAKNTGFSGELIQAIQNFIFLDEHDLGDEIRRFDPSYEMAETWRRLIEGKNIQKHDGTLLKHEEMERELMLQGYTQDKARIITSRKYDYSEEARQYYDKIKKHH